MPYIGGELALDETALVQAVIHIRLAGKAITAKEVLQMLETEGLAVTLSQVKKAASKAAKSGKLRQPLDGEQIKKAVHQGFEFYGATISALTYLKEPRK